MQPSDAVTRARGGQPRVFRKRRLLGGNIKLRKSAAEANARMLATATAEFLDESKDYEENRGVDLDHKSIFNIFGFTAAQQRSLPRAADRKAGTVAESSSGWSTLVQSVLKASKAVAEALYPGNVPQLLRAVALKILGREKPEVELERAAESIARVMIKARKASLEKRVLRAVLTKGFSDKILLKVGERIMEEMGEDGASDDDEQHQLPWGKEKKGRKWKKQANPLPLRGSSKQKAYQDYNALAEGARIESLKRRLARFNEINVLNAVKFILQPKMVGALSWGVKQVCLSADETVELPKLVRRVSLTDMYKSYVATYQTESERISRGSFFQIAKQITSSDEKLLTAVDYVTGVLIHDSVSTLQDMIDTFSPTPERKEKLTHYLTLTRNFLKVQYKDHITLSEEDNVPTHGKEFALNSACGEETRANKCNACDFVMYFLAELRKEIELAGAGESPRKANDLVQDALKVLCDITHKFELYQGHCVRVINQQHAISEIHDILEKECLQKKRTTRAVMTIDWKMKFEAKSARETTQQHFGKRGMSWHGCLVEYYRPITVSETQEDGSIVEKVEAERVNVYIDQIMEGTNKQNAMAVGCMVEAALKHVRKQLPEIESIILQSDNAKCYNSNLLRVLIALINSRSPLKVERHIFTETQDGKGLIDAHFARGTAHLMKFMKSSMRNRIRAIITPKGLAYALGWNGGITNSCVQLVRLNRSKTEALGDLVKNTAKGIHKHFTRCNDVVFFNNHPRALVTVDDVNAAAAANTTFLLKYFTYSGIGSGVLLSVFIGQDKKPKKLEVETDQPKDDIDGQPEDDDGYDSDAAVADADNSDNQGNDFIIDQGVEIDRNEVVIENVEEETGSDTDTDEDGESDNEEADSDDDAVPEEIHAYSSVNEDGSDMLTGVSVLKQSGFGVIKGPRTTGRARRTRVHKESGLRKDMVAFAVRCAGELVNSHNIKIHDGRKSMVEYEKASTISTKPRNRGWARRPPHGSQYGARYMSEYKNDILQFFNKGLEESGSKMGPGQMHEALKEKYSARFSLPSESEIRSEISQLFGKSKSKNTTKANGTGTTEANGTGKRGRQSIFTEEVEEFMIKIIVDNPEIKPADGLAQVRERFGDKVSRDESVVTDATLKSKLSNLKSKRKKAKH